MRNLITTARSWLAKVSSIAVAPLLVVFVIGFAAGAAWQSYGNVAKQAIAGWSPRLAWLAPATASGSNSSERFKAMSHALATARQSLDKLSTEMSKAQAQDGDASRRRTTH